MGGFGPQLTPYGRQFKLLGYTLKAGSDTKVPLALMLVESYTHTSKAQTAPPANGFNTNNNTQLQQASVFVAGRISDHMGMLAQATYQQSSGLFGWDNSDLRYARSLSTANHTAIWGVSLNNNPSLSDVFNTSPAWQFPYTSSNLTPAAPAVPILMGGLAQQAVGLDAYTQIDSALYVEGGVYRTLSPAFLRDVNASYGGRVAGVAPYARLAYTWNLENGNLELGGLAFNARRGLTGASSAGQTVAVAGPSDSFRDMGVDASYQFLNGGDHIVTASALYLHERERLDATYASGGSSHLHDSLHAVNLDASYWYQNTWGATFGASSSDGSNDVIRYSNNGSPNTDSRMVELDWNPFGKANSWVAPFVNMRLGLQYTWYTKFAGLVHNIDGAGRNAADNDTLYLYLWMAI
ncbi:cytochrome C [Dyella flagellata]